MAVLPTGTANNVATSLGHIGELRELVGRWNLPAHRPLYLGLVFGYSGVSILTQAWWAFVLLPVVLVVMQRAVIEREERYLERKFGQDYLQYKQRVRRWL